MATRLEMMLGLRQFSNSALAVMRSKEGLAIIAESHAHRVGVFGVAVLLSPKDGVVCGNGVPYPIVRCGNRETEIPCPHTRITIFPNMSTRCGCSRHMGGMKSSTAVRGTAIGDWLFLIGDSAYTSKLSPDKLCKDRNSPLRPEHRLDQPAHVQLWAHQSLAGCIENADGSMLPDSVASSFLCVFS